MTEQPPSYAPPAPPQTQRRGNGFGTTALVFGILATVLGFIPFIDVVSFGLGPLAVIFGVVGLIRSTQRLSGRGTSIAGIVLGVAGLLLAIVFVSLVYTAATSLGKQADAAHTVTYEIGGSAKKVDITYTHGDTSTSQANGVRTPWVKHFNAKGLFRLYSVSAQNSRSRGSVTCKIIEDGKVVKSSKSKGAFAIASCNYMP